MLDTHCHLNFKAFADDAHQVAQTMADQQVSGIVVGCDTVSTRAGITLAQTFPNLWASVGLHPIHVLKEPWDPALMKELALEERVVAIGEVGLDFYRFPEDPTLHEPYKKAQYETFRQAIALAQQVKKPLIIHSREAYDQIITVLQEELGSNPPVLPGTVHCYMGNWQQALALLDLNFMLGFTGVITYRDVDPSLLEVITKMPADRLLIETDAPYLTPEPYRTEGKQKNKKIPRNLPSYVRQVAQTIADLRQTSIEEIIELTEANGRRLFQLEGERYV